MNAWIHVPYWSHATLLEVLWLVGGLTSALITCANVRDSLKDRAVVADIRNDPAIHERHWLMISTAAKGRLSSQWTRLRISLYIVAIGIFAIIQSNPFGGRTTWTGLLVTVGLLGIAFETAFMSFRDYRRREQMYDLAMGRSAVIAALMLADARAKACKEPPS